MFKKIHSNRDPNETVFSQIRKEFAPHFERCSKTITSILKRKPKLFFYLMIVLMAFSAIVSFIVFINKEPVTQKKKVVHIDVVHDGFDQISAAAAAIRQTIALKKAIDSLTTKRTLSKKDSNALDSDLIKLEQLNKPYKR